jgi:hypothetical protein
MVLEPPILATTSGYEANSIFSGFDGGHAGALTDTLYWLNGTVCPYIVDRRKSRKTLARRGA